MGLFGRREKNRGSRGDVPDSHVPVLAEHQAAFLRVLVARRLEAYGLGDAEVLGDRVVVSPGVEIGLQDLALGCLAAGDEEAWLPVVSEAIERALRAEQLTQVSDGAIQVHVPEAFTTVLNQVVAHDGR